MIRSERGPRTSLLQSWEKKNRSGPIAPTAVNFSHSRMTAAHFCGLNAEGTSSPPPNPASR